MKTRLIFSLLFFCITILLSSFLNAQTPGLIYKPSSTAFGKSVLNPSGSGYVSANAGGFTTNVDYGTASELQMIPIPFLSLEPPNDLKTGAGFGHTDIVRNDADATQSQSVYLLVKNVGGTDYLIVRFRLGKSSTASKGYSILLDTDATYSGSGANPGFEYEVVLETGFRVAVYNHVNATVQSFDINEYSQRSIAASTVGGSNNVFYDFFVPLSALGPDDPVRFAATTITSAQSGINGTISDVDGVDDKKYANNVPAILKAMINAFPPTKLSTLTQGGSFPPALTTAPAITSRLNIASISISGTSQEVDGTTITVYKNGSSIGTTTVTNNAWTLSGVSGLVLGDLITARAQASGKSLSDLSNEVEVTGVELCYLPAPVVTARNNGSRNISGTWTPVSGTITANTVKIRVYQQTAKNTFVQLAQKSGSMDTVVQTDGSWLFDAVMAQSDFGKAALYVTAEFNGCVSRYSNISQGNTGTLTLAPTITTDPILASTGPRNVSVTNNHSAAATLILYINGNFVDSSATMIGSGLSHTFSYSGFIEGERVTARAQANGSNTIWLSNPSNTVIVTTTAAQTTAPEITGQYIAGSGKTVTGISTEEPGTTITLYKAGTTLLGTTTVDAFGVWEVTGLTLATSDVLTAYAQAIGKSLSNVSNEVTVAASAPTPPTVTGSYQAGATSVSGTGGQGTVTVYVDDSPIGTTSGASWTLSDIPSNQLYKGAVIKATNTVSGIESDFSNEVTVTGVNSFTITLPDNNPVPDQTAGIAFDVKFTAKDGADGTGSTVTTFTGTVVVASTSTITNGGGLSGSFSSGILTPHNMTLITAGTDKTIEIVSTDDPTAFGITTLDVLTGAPSVSNSTLTADPTSIAADGVETSLITVKLYDAYDNEITTGGATVTISKSFLFGTLTGVTDNGNGTYTADLSSNLPGLAYISSTVNSSRLEDSVLVTFTADSPVYYSIKTGNWNDASAWSLLGHSGPAAETPPGENDICFIGDNDTIWLNVGVVNNGIIYVENTGWLMTGMNEITGTGDFILMAGGTLGLGSPGGIDGNIKVTGTHTFDTQGNLVYYYNGNQTIGNGSALTINDLTVDGGALKNMSSDIVVDGHFKLQDGSVSIGEHSLTLSGPIDFSGGIIRGAVDPVTNTGTSDLIINGSGDITGDMIINARNYLNNFYTNRDVGLDFNPPSQYQGLYISGDMTLDNAEFSLGSQTLHLSGDLIQIGTGNLVGSTEAKFHVYGTGDINIPEITLGVFGARRDGNVILDGPMTVQTLQLDKGTIQNASNLSVETIWVNSGQLDEAPASVDNVYYKASPDNLVTSFELPSDITRIRIQTQGNIILDKNLTAVEQIILNSGFLNVNGNDIILTPETGTVTEQSGYLRGTSGSVTYNGNLSYFANKSNPGGLGLRMTKRGGSSMLWGNTTITRGFDALEVRPGEFSINRHYVITPTNSSNSKIDFWFHYLPEDLNNNDPNDLKLYMSIDDGVTWTLIPGQVPNYPNNVISKTGFTFTSANIMITAMGSQLEEGLIVEGNDQIKDNDKKKASDRTKGDDQRKNDEKSRDGENQLKTNEEAKSREDENISEIEIRPEIPSEFGLVQNYPNPFNPVTSIKFALPENDLVTVKVFDITGREIAELVNSHLNAGYHTVQFDGTNLSSGIYFYRIVTGSGFSKIMKMSLIK